MFIFMEYRCGKIDT